MDENTEVVPPAIQRYGTTFYWSGIPFTLSEPFPPEDECRFLLLKILEQAIRDYINLQNSSILLEKFYFQTAEGILFDDDYRINYGGHDMSLSDILHAINIEQEWFRDKVDILRDKRLKERELKKQLKHE